eukprot:COSAG04_NODE_7359_length_1141_cov_1.137236_2_plen_195_part_00
MLWREIRDRTFQYFPPPPPHPPHSLPPPSFSTASNLPTLASFADSVRTCQLISLRCRDGCSNCSARCAPEPLSFGALRAKTAGACASPPCPAPGVALLHRTQPPPPALRRDARPLPFLRARRSSEHRRAAPVNPYAPSRAAPSTATQPWHIGSGGPPPRPSSCTTAAHANGGRRASEDHVHDVAESEHRHPRDT